MAFLIFFLFQSGACLQSSIDLINSFTPFSNPIRGFQFNLPIILEMFACDLKDSPGLLGILTFFPPIILVNKLMLLGFELATLNISLEFFFVQPQEKLLLHLLHV